MSKKNIILLASKNWTLQNNVANHLLTKYSFSKLNYNNMETLLFYINKTKIKNDLVISNFSFNNDELKRLCKKTDHNLGILSIDNTYLISTNIPIININDVYIKDVDIKDVDSLLEQTDISLRKLEYNMFQYEMNSIDKFKIFYKLYEYLVIISVLTMGALMDMY